MYTNIDFLRFALAATIVAVPMFFLEQQNRKWATGYAHRVSYELANGPIPAGLQIDHLCKLTLCVRPSHLEAVTPSVNVRRSDMPMAIIWRTGLCKRGHERSSVNTQITTQDGKERRHCRVCARIRYRERRITTRPLDVVPSA